MICNQKTAIFQIVLSFIKCNSTEALVKSAPMGGFALAMDMSMHYTKGNFLNMVSPILPATCSISFEGIFISSLMMSYMAA